MPDTPFTRCLDDAPLQPASEPDLEEEVYAALRAAGASPEEAQSCMVDSRSGEAA